jgi:glycerol-3-phosphate acyltransferase PlsY
MNIWIAILAAATGYLSGSISFIRVIAYFVKPTSNIEKIEVPIPDTKESFRSDSVSATAARMHMGTRYGVLTAILDIFKVAIPTLIFLLWQTEEPYHLITAATGLIGHNWPVYHRFKGGRGESAIYGGLLVINPLGVLLMNVAGALFGLFIGHILIFRWGGLVLMIPWLWFTTHSWPHLLYIISANLIYWITMRPELKQYYNISKASEELSQEFIASEFAMGAKLGKIMDKYSILALFKKVQK